MNNPLNSVPTQSQVSKRSRSGGIRTHDPYTPSKVPEPNSLISGQSQTEESRSVSDRFTPIQSQLSPAHSNPGTSGDFGLDQGQQPVSAPAPSRTIPGLLSSNAPTTIEAKGLL